MATAVRPYKLRTGLGSSFISRLSPTNDQFALEDLARSCLHPDDILAGTSSDVPAQNYASAAYIIPYFDLEGRVITDREGVLSMYRARYKVPQLSKEPRYMQPPREVLEKYNLPGHIPYLLPYNKDLDNGTLYCVEGEKKTASVIKHCKVAAFGIAGCQMWRNPNGTGGVHPWILDYIARHGAKKIVIIPDADVLRYDMSQCYGTYASHLKRLGFEVSLLHPKGKIDDLIYERKGDVEGLLDGIERIAPDALVQSPSFLAEVFNLGFKVSAKGHVEVHQTTSNVTKLLEEHTAFPTIWRNLDTNKVMLGEEEAIPDVSELLIANHMQHYFGLTKVTDHMVIKCLGAVAKQNARSPLLERIKGVEWDGVERLSTWMQRHWGVEDTPHARDIGKKWLVSACSRLDKPGTKIDWMLIVTGPQGIGKTSMPKLFFGDNYKVVYGERDDKDEQMLFGAAACIGFDELDSFGKKETSRLKAMITQNVDTYRPPYGSGISDFPRRSILYGSGNKLHFLQGDPSGYRRYGIIYAPRMLDFAAVALEADQLWAEAWHLYQSEKLAYWEVDASTNNAEDYTIPDPLEEMVLSHIKAQAMNKYGGNTQGGVFEFTMSQLLTWMGERDLRNSGLNRELAGIITKFGGEQKMKRVDGKPARVWHLPL